MADKRNGGNGFGVPASEDDFDDVVIEGIKPTESLLAAKEQTSECKVEQGKDRPSEASDPMKNSPASTAVLSDMTKDNPASKATPLNEEGVVSIQDCHAENALKDIAEETFFQLETTNDKTSTGPSEERKYGAGFGIPPANEDEVTVRSSTENIPEKQARKQNISETREGGGGFGIPAVEGSDDVVIPVEDGGDYPFRIKKKKLMAATAEDEYETIALQSTFITRLQKLYLSALVILAAFMSFYIITQTTNFIIQLKDCPALVKYPLYTAVCILALVIFYFIIKLVGAWLSLKRCPRVSLGMLEILSKRRDLREKCYKKSDEACEDLFAILDGIQEDQYKKSLKAMHVSEEAISELFESRAELCKHHKARLAGKSREASIEWINTFANKYQAKLDYLANERIKYYSYHGGIAATISHIPAMDRFIVLSAMFGMVKDLLEIYNIKPSRTNTSILLSKIIINTFCAGYVQEGAAAYSERVNRALSAFKITFTSIPIVKDFFQASVSLGVEATAHAFLIYRVGTEAQKMLFPIVKK